MRRRSKYLWGGAAVLCLLAVPVCRWQNDGLMLTRYTAALPGLPEELEGLTLVQVSDLHSKRMGEGQEVLLNTISQAKPDVILLTGDLVDGRQPELEPALELARGTAALAPTYYVTGNHETSLPRKTLEQIENGLEAEGVVLLDNRTEELSLPGGGTMVLTGLCDDNLGDGTLERLNASWPEDAVTVLLAHEPQYIENYAASGVDLAFCGHAHGGQIRLPLVGGLFAPGQGFLPKYTAGIYQLGETQMVVSRGIGGSLFPQRVWNRPEVVAVTLKRG